MVNNSRTQSFDDQVHTGFWINHVKGPTYGATLTLNQQAGNFLIAFLALYVGVTGQSFWTIARFLLHKHLSSKSRSDGVYHQQQAILRNSKTAPGAVQDTLTLLIAWRKRSRGLIRRLLPVWIVASVISAGFAVAGVFSSQITANQSNEVLLLGPECGKSLDNQDSSNAVSSGLVRYRNEMFLEYLNYAFACYQDRQRTQSACQIYTKPKLHYKVDRNATCPFQDTICQKSSNNLYIDSGYLDSWGDLGINAEPRFQVRLTQHCAPLVTDGYKSKYISPSDPLKTFMRYSYLHNDTITNSTSDIMDWRIFLVPLKDEFDEVARYWSDSVAQDYRTRSIQANDIYGDSTFVADLNRTDAFVALMFLDSTDVLSREKVEDPWFAHTVNASQRQYEFFGSDSLYLSDEPATVIGCAAQVFYCNPKITDPQRRCINYFVTEASDIGFSALWPEESDLKAFNGYIATNNVMIATPDSFYNTPGLPNLLARLTMDNSIQWDHFAPDRWKEEMEFLAQASLASFQSNVPQATQNGVWYMNRTLCDSDTETGLCEKLCRNQKVRSSEYYSFNVLGMSIIIFVGVFLMVVGAFIENIATTIGNTFSRDKQHNPPYSRLEWESNSFLDLQRLAHQALGVGNWTRSRTGIPITAPGEQLGVLDSAGQSKLPILKRPRIKEELQDLVSRSGHQRSSSAGHVMGPEYVDSFHSPFDYAKHRRSDNGAPNEDSAFRSSVPSRYLRRPGYARVYTDEADTIYTGSVSNTR
ncbi:hypothetical protein DPSP01_011952 [Paraphaeosphaeria sporulosa]|uniref:Uncharacterized protein n=1 Tax=Paraphaeosphaeria sporulosa TaxID=1460663 RepID=A0A177CX87_9PLEO|nr:uncharacterized protein CC84DRAFT_1253967 [Paraphaeosphaeria sporulosa]OAG11512.1 hypothetical protein CC84DRAFT_1253967 [Paraphaeosphaeria sporulosa]